MDLVSSVVPGTNPLQLITFMKPFEDSLYILENLLIKTDFIFLHLVKLIVTLHAL